jgi:GntR family carbon starvation induced transcriptional regulator
MASVDSSGGPGGLAHTAWKAIRDDIIAGRLNPAFRLRLSKLRERYRIGGTPLREALSRLTAEGFVTSNEGRGFAVAPISLAEFRELTDLRKLLEKECLRLSIEHGDIKWEGGILASLHQLADAHRRIGQGDRATVEEWERLNQEFHNALVAACPSAWLRHFRELIYLYTERYRRICLTTPATGRDVHREHKQLCDAVLGRDVDRAHQLIDEHLERTFRKVRASGRLAY